MNEKILYWTELAEYDLVTAQAMLTAGRYLYVGFMCHQSIEKILKAAIVSAIPDETPPHIHNLRVLAKSAQLLEEMSSEQKTVLSMLMPMNIEARYPESKEALLVSLDLARCTQIIKETEGLFVWIKTMLSKK